MLVSLYTVNARHLRLSWHDSLKPKTKEAVFGHKPVMIVPLPSTGPVDVTAVTAEATAAMTVRSRKSCRFFRWLCKVPFESQNCEDVTAEP